MDEQRAVQALVRQLDFYGEEVRVIDADSAKAALASVDTRWVMTIPGVDVTVAIFRGSRRGGLLLVLRTRQVRRYRVEPSGETVRRTARIPRRRPATP